MKTVMYVKLQKRDAWFTLHFAAVQTRFGALRGFAIPLPPYRAFPPYFTFHRRAPKPGGFFFGPMHPRTAGFQPAYRALTSTVLWG